MAKCSRLATGGVAWLGLWCGACSLVFSAPPPAGAERGQARPFVDCSTSNVAPIIDSVLASYELVGSGLALAADDDDYRKYPISRRTDIALGLGFAAAFVGSAVYGYSSAARCRRVKHGPPNDGYVIGVSPAPEPAGRTEASP
jgi:hypothetical protein